MNRNAQVKGVVMLLVTVNLSRCALLIGRVASNCHCLRAKGRWLGLYKYISSESHIFSILRFQNCSSLAPRSLFFWVF